MFKTLKDYSEGNKRYNGVELFWRENTKLVVKDLSKHLETGSMLSLNRAYTRLRVMLDEIESYIENSGKLGYAADEIADIENWKQEDLNKKTHEMRFRRHRENIELVIKDIYWKSEGRKDPMVNAIYRFVDVQTSIIELENCRIPYVKYNEELLDD